MRSLVRGLAAVNRFVSVSINGQPVNVPSGTTIYEASCEVLPKYERIPTICYHPYVEADGNCRICLVESTTDFGSSLVPACVTEVTEGMSIQTDTPDVNDNIRAVLKLMLSQHPLECPTCEVNGECIFQDLLAKFDISPKDLGVMQDTYLDRTTSMMEGEIDVFGSNALTLDPSKCLKCTLCIRACSELVDMNILGMKGRGSEEAVSCFNKEEDFDLLECIGCGACTFICPTAAIRVNSDVGKVADYLKTKAMMPASNDLVLVAQTAPAVRVTLAEDLHMKAGDITPGQMVAGLRAVGFDHVFDTDFTADLTILEEGFELLARVGSGGPFPMFTSCCPAWVNMVEKKYPEFIPNLSTCKSPQQMLGALLKKYWAPKVGIPAANVVNVSIMPCTAKKDERARDQLSGDVDVVLTTRELARLFKLHHVDVASLEDEAFDDPLGESTGAAVIFGATGGVMEAALRTAYEVATGEVLPSVDFEVTRGLEGIKKATVMVGDLPVNVAIVHKGANIQKFLRMLNEGHPEVEGLHFVEVMTCYAGCVGGGGNPKLSADKEIPLMDRLDAIYSLDAGSDIRRSHENPSVQLLYETFLGKPNSHVAHDLLHTFYEDRKVKKDD